MKQTPLKRTGFSQKPRKPMPRATKPMANASAKNRKKKRPLRKAARGEDCTLRLSGCRYDPDYTVLAHLRKFNWAGAGHKPNDVLGVFACDICHDKQETHDPECTDTHILRALGDTLLAQLRRGTLKVMGEVDL